MMSIGIDLYWCGFWIDKEGEEIVIDGWCL